jgi:acyl-coenzyme A thioesterase PaaI-like protein
MNTAMMRAWALQNVFFLWLASPQIVELTDERCVVRVPLNWRTRRRDIRAMYLGTLCMGADVAAGLISFKLVREGKLNVSFVFKDMKAEFLKRAEGDVYFTNNEGRMIQDLLRRAIETGERQEATVPVIATVPSKLGDEPVARFTLTLSLKKRS